MNTDPSHFEGNDRPVEKVSWYDAYEFVRQLNDTSKILFRLPTEAEWEYAACTGQRRSANGATWLEGILLTAEDAEVAGKIMRPLR